MAINPSHSIVVSWNDQSGETGTMKINQLLATDMNTLPITFTALMTALGAELTLGLAQQYSNSDIKRLTNQWEGGGNREDKVLMIYEDLVTLKVYNSELPCRKTVLTTIGNGSDSIPPASWAATKTAWDAFVKSPDGNATSLIDCQIVGRNV